MVRLLTIVLIGLSALGAAAPEARAQAVTGPFCFSTSPFANVFAWFIFTSSPGAQLLATGRDLTDNAPQTVSISVVGNTAQVGFVTHGNPPVIGNGTIDLSTLTGPGTCYQVNAGTTGCVNGTAFTFAPVECPPGAAAE